MPLPTPNLDDRRFQQLVNEAKERIPRYCPQWTDHNVSDPGITLIELFAWMTEQLLFRLNQVPDKNYITFLDLIGVRLEPARPARGDVTFRLSGPPSSTRRCIIPAWTEVATPRTEMEEAIVFTTDYEAEVLPPKLRWLLTSLNEEEYVDRSAAIQSGERAFDVWGTPPRASNALYIGFEEDISAHVLVMNFTCENREGIGIRTDRPPWIWQAWRGRELGWETITVGFDNTKGLNVSGEVWLYLPYRCQPHRLEGREGRTWIRCSPLEKLPAGENPYKDSPSLLKVAAHTMGITVPVTHALPVGPEILGISNGQPGQMFSVQHQNVLKLRDQEETGEGEAETVEVEMENDQWEPWKLVPDFGDSLPTDKHYTFDPITGTVEFGPVVRQPNGTEPQFGAIPPKGHRIRIRQYRIGGGVRGNVAAERVKLLKSTVPYVASVTNRDQITGGLEAQSLDDAKLRAPALLRTRFRAVTAEDFEYLAGQVEGVGRVRCLQPRPGDPQAPAPGKVLLLVIPQLPPLEGAELDRHVSAHEALTQADGRARVEQALQRELILPSLTELRLYDELDSRRLLTTRLEIRAPEYVWVAVETRIRTNPKAEPERVARDVKAALYKFLHPLYGGSEGTGWPFGRPLTIDKVYALIQTVPGVDYATDLKLYPIDLSSTSGQRLGRNTQVIEVPVNGVIVSYYHNVSLAR